ncbi:MAG TPA: 2-phosphosulfolactate phosphatase [Phycisphaerales bacterium]
MPAPDLGPAPAHVITERPLAVHLLPALAAPEALAGGVVIMIDALRASVTISAALGAGATRVVPTLTVEDAERLRGPGRLLGGERGGVLIPGFDLDNSPRAFTPERVRGKEIVFTTANGTAALLHASAAHEVLIGAVTNVSAIVARVACEPRAVHILCAGTRGEITMDDCLAAGLIAERLVAAGRQVVSDDSTRMCVGLARLAAAHPHGLESGVLELMRESRGGRGLTRLGFEEDLRLCSTIDAVPVVPVFAESAITCGLPS